MKMQNNKKGSSIKFLAIAGIAILSIAGVIGFEKIQSANGQNVVVQNGNTSPQVVTIQWPPAGWWTNGQQHTPLNTTVVIGVNNTIRWVNGDQKMEWITADNNDDQDFGKAAPYFVSVSELPHTYKVQKTISVGPEETEVFFNAPDSLKNSFFTMPMKYANNVLAPEQSFEYTFTHAGTFGYHSRAWERGYVTVLDGGKSQ